MTTEKVRTGRPLLEVRVPSYESSHPPGTEIIVAHFATFFHLATPAHGVKRLQ